jgi:Stigma-specific protein, Stig1
MPTEGPLEAVARGLAGGMSRRQALRKGGAVLVATFALSPSDALARVTKRCPHHRVRCNGHCCPAGEVCLHPKRRKHQRRKPKPRCGCKPGTVRCKGQCVRLKTDVHNCGRCGHRCGPGQQCQNARCVKSCPPGEAFCGGKCISVSADPNNCGGCGQKCGAGGVCHNGGCLNACPPDYAECKGGCIDLANDGQNCGACGAVCATGTACIQGNCSSGGCPSGTVNCKGTCVNVGTNANNCGACGSVCPGTQVCVSYGCSSACPPSQTLCTSSRNCVNTKTSGANCGACGNSCPSGTVCSNGTCISGSCPSGTVACSGGCCAGSACCSDGGCQTQHNNGVGQYYYDCTALGAPGRESSYSLSLAKEAAAAAAPGASTVTTSCPGGYVLGVSTSSGYAYWGYSGSIAGFVHLAGAPTCPISSDPTWN